MAAPALSAPPALPREALDLFERGMAALQRHAYDRASEAFEALAQSETGERALIDRARVYLELCDRELRRRPVAPATSEERLTAATLALNNGNDKEAERLAKHVLNDDPRQDLAAYLLAAIEARRGHVDAAMTRLRQAIDLNPGSRAQARHDEDFAAFHDLEAFRSLTEPPPASNADRRPRRGRS
jgi:tetratricopeptide (TPR) repeat protein